VKAKRRKVEASFGLFRLSDFQTSKKNRFFASRKNKNDLVAQPVEQLTLNQWVESSILSQVTKKAFQQTLEGFFIYKQTLME
jgi:hypothetical protein